MGTGVAENLLKNGFRLTVHERSERVRQWASGRSGVRLTPSLRELGSLSKVVLILVTDNRALAEVLYSPEGIHWEAAMDRLGGNADFSRIYEFVKRKNDLKTL
ncbi:MAG: NAD(P)-binding domain-containing protein, partial [candidate division NC10 bacterium]|nr:NAD(P)-binding domain-containing protein [candidate division NC10 bacterium]